jgi:hypothetical protein
VYVLYSGSGGFVLEARCKRQIHLPIRISRGRQCGIASGQGTYTLPDPDDSRRLNVAVPKDSY